MRYEDIELLIKSDERFTGCQLHADISEDGIVILEGHADSWRHVVDIGHLAAGQPGVRNVVNNLTTDKVRAVRRDRTEEIRRAKEQGVYLCTDVVIIGAGICGCAIARELSKYQLGIAVVEKNADVSEEATKANNGYIHPGHKAKPGTLKAKLNVKGNAMYPVWAKELGFDLDPCGQISVAYSEEDMDYIRKIYKDAVENGVPGICMMSAKEIMAEEPNLVGTPVGGVKAPTMAMVEPYQVCVALAENAAVNGAQFFLSEEVLDIVPPDSSSYSVITERRIIKARYVINCAGIHADDIAEMVDDKFYTLHARRGGLAIFDKALDAPFHRALSTQPKNRDKESKGGGFSFTPEHNIMVGPSAVEIPDKEDKSVMPEDIEYALARGQSIWPDLNRKDIIAMYAGIRAADYKEDFIIETSRKLNGFIHVAGIQSPGLASAPAIAAMVEKLLLDCMSKDGEEVEINHSFNPKWKRPVKFRRLPVEEQAELIEKNPSYGQIICRCEKITEGEILDAIHSPVVPTTVDAIKRRTRAGMGRCQGGFCQPRVVEILARELGKDWVDIYLKGRNGYILEKKSR